jgi:hypothetical protein
MRKVSSAEFNKLRDGTYVQLVQLRDVKGGEYALDDDVLANFKRNAAALGLEPETVWAVYAGKHWDAIQTFVRDTQTGKERVRSEPIIGRVYDLMVYLQLMVAMLEARASSFRGTDAARTNDACEGTSIPVGTRAEFAPYIVPFRDPVEAPNETLHEYADRLQRLQKFNPEIIGESIAAVTKKLNAASNSALGIPTRY